MSITVMEPKGGCGEGSQLLNRGLGWRHCLCTLVFLIIVICYADRTNIGIVLAQADFPGIPHEDKGTILSAFFAGYFCTQLLGGWLAQRLGAKPTLLLAATVWTIFDVLTPLAARGGIVLLVLDRICMGLGEGMVFPTQHAFSSFWVPKHERAFLVNFMSSGMDIGSVIANLISPSLAAHGTWCVFAFWGSLAVLWCLAFAGLGASAPEVHKRCLETGEAHWIQQHRGASHFQEARLRRGAALPWRLLRESPVWAIISAHMGVNYGWYVMLSWMPSFFKGRYSLDLSDHTLLMAAPYVASWCGGVIGGRISDALVARGFRTLHIRKWMQVCGALGNTICLQLAVLRSDSSSAAAWFAAASFLVKLQMSGFWVNMVDICPETAGTLMGMSNTLGTIPGILGQPITQLVLDSSGGESSPRAWHTVFSIGCAAMLLGTCVFLAFADDVSVEEAAPRPEKTNGVVLGRQHNTVSIEGDIYEGQRLAVD